MNHTEKLMIFVCVNLINLRLGYSTPSGLLVFADISSVIEVQSLRDLLARFQCVVAI